MIHRDEKYFPEPELFKPERFLAENTAKRNPYAYIPFSFGKRNCIGQRFAMMEEKVILANILRNFEIICEQGLKDIKVYLDLILRSENEILYTLKPRVEF